MNMTDAIAFDPLNDVGLDHMAKMRFWMTYITLNFVGCIFCVMLIYAVYRLANKSSSDIFAAALCFACFIMSGTCGMQCILNYANEKFAYGEKACYAEALFHMIAIVNMFEILTLMAFDSYRTVVKGESMGAKGAMKAVGISWAISALGIGLFSLDSPIYMAESGVFCFFRFDSSLMYAFFLPVFAITAGAMCYYYFKIFSITRAALKQFGAHLNINDNRKKVQMRLAQKLFTFVIVFLASWLIFVVGILLQLIVGDIFSLDAIGGVTGVLHTIAVPISYGLINPRLREQMLYVMTCGFRKTGGSSNGSKYSTHTHGNTSADSKHTHTNEHTPQPPYSSNHNSRKVAPEKQGQQERLSVPGTEETLLTEPIISSGLKSATGSPKLYSKRVFPPSPVASTGSLYSNGARGRRSSAPDALAPISPIGAASHAAGLSDMDSLMLPNAVRADLESEEPFMPQATSPTVPTRTTRSASSGSRKAVKRSSSDEDQQQQTVVAHGRSGSISVTRISPKHAAAATGEDQPAVPAAVSPVPSGSGRRSGSVQRSSSEEEPSTKGHVTIDVSLGVQNQAAAPIVAPSPFHHSSVLAVARAPSPQILFVPQVHSPSNGRASPNFRPSSRSTQQTSNVEALLLSQSANNSASSRATTGYLAIDH